MEENEITNTSLGKLLRKKREDLEISYSDLSQELQIPIKYIRALEEENYRIFGAKIYAKGFLIKISEKLGLEKSEKVLELFELSWKESLCLDQNANLFRRNRKNNIIFTPGLLSLLGGSFFFLFWVFFFGWRISRIILPPKLDLIEPQDRMLLADSRLKIKGFAQKESKVSVNGREINIDNQGAFNTYINLRQGLNTLDFYAQSRFGKIKKVVRYVVLK
ncbi:MAG: helix-turn-helix domain-containing protein [bacterium]|nr:helix-turn-helix domain-containing protein [bacterium]